MSFRKEVQKGTKMYYINIMLPLLIICTNVLSEKDENITSSYLEYPKDSSCGLKYGSDIVQIVARTYSFADGLYWTTERKKLYFVDRFESTFNIYHPESGESNGFFIEDLAGKELAAVFPVKGRQDKLIIAAGQSIYVFTKEKKDGKEIHSIKNIFKITDDSRVLSKACTTRKSHIYIGTLPSDYEDQYPNIEKGKAQFMIVDLDHKNISILEDNYTLPGGVAIDSKGEYRYHADSKENKIWRREMVAGSELELVFDMDDYNKTLTGHVTAITLDNDGKLWIALFHSFQIVQFDIEEKVVIRQIPIVASMVTSLAWGGSDFKTLYLGTTSKFVDLRAIPAAGSIIAISGTGSRGYKQNELIVAEDWLE